MEKIDELDLAILRALSENGRLSIRELANKVHRSPTPVFERLRRLEAGGVIRGYTVTVDMEKLGRGFTVICNVKLNRINNNIHQEFARLIMEMPEVRECYNVSGAYDYLLKVQVPDMAAYRHFVTVRLGELPMLDSVHSVFVMDTVKFESPGIM